MPRLDVLVPKAGNDAPGMVAELERFGATTRIRADGAWAQGHPIDRDQLTDTVEALTQGPDASIDGTLALGNVVRQWADHHNIDLQSPRSQHERVEATSPR